MLPWIARLQAAKDGGFWPSRLNEWLELFAIYVVALGAAVTAIWRKLTGPLREAIAVESANRKKADDARDALQREVSEKMHNLAGRLYETERGMERAQQERGFMNQTIGRIEQSVDRLAISQATNDRDRSEELATIREGVAKIMGKLGIDE